MPWIRSILTMASLVAASFTLTGCGSNETGVGAAPAGGGKTVSTKSKAAATVVVDGSSTVYRISKAAQEAFESENADTTVIVDNHGTGGGFGRYLEGEVDIVDASRPISQDEATKAKARGLDWTSFTVGNDGITVVVNPRNELVKLMTVEQLKKLWQPGSTVKTWRDLDSAWPDRKIILYSPDNDSGTFEFFTEAIVGKKKSQRDDVQQSSDDNTLVNGVVSDQDGIGYFGYAYYAANKDRLRAVAIQNGADAKPVLPSSETIADKTYKPLSRPLFIYVKNSAAKRPEIKQFLTFYLDNVDKLSVKGGYDPPTADEQKANKEVFSKLYP
ncbi:MAG TPA: PstS family phosphate ABC transporter substrate-binding protein [Isosphaeraceae bacterium]|nr:PstS family phosphate ABC transporter substrate-binding protein [Isosphaeraceae bacterium]